MKKGLMLLVVSIFIVMLSSCALIGENEILQLKYCEEFPNDSGCSENQVPNEGVIDDVLCREGFVLEGNTCVPEDTASTCGEDYVLYAGSCLNPCELPYDNTDYFPCFRDLSEEAVTTIHKLKLATGNSYFDDFTMWVQNTSQNGSSEFELHHTLKGETELIVSNGGIKLWCSPHREGCENLYKANFTVSSTSGDIMYKFEFWYDELWYTKVEKVTYDEWNAETNEYETIDLEIYEFYLEDVQNVE